MNTTTSSSQVADTQTRMPTSFIPHGGGPCFFMDWHPADAWTKMADYLKGIAATLPEKPRAIVMVSAHWLESEFSVTSHPAPSLIYDYYGFPPHTYELQYPAPGEPDLARRIVTLLQQAGLPAKEDAERWFDHGMFISADADVPRCADSGGCSCR